MKDGVADEVDACSVPMDDTSPMAPGQDSRNPYWVVSLFVQIFNHLRIMLCVILRNLL